MSDFGKTSTANAQYVYNGAANGFTPFRSSTTAPPNAPKENSFINNSHLLVYPNPIVNEITLKYICPIKGNVSILLFDNNGRMVEQKTVACNIANSFILTKLDVSRFTKGIYRVQVITSNGSLIDSSQFIKGQ